VQSDGQTGAGAVPDKKQRTGLVNRRDLAAQAEKESA
jgi:hypothetical protein